MSTGEFPFHGGHLDGAWQRLPLDERGRPPAELMTCAPAGAAARWTGDEIVAVGPVATRYRRAQRIGPDGHPHGWAMLADGYRWEELAR